MLKFYKLLFFLVFVIFQSYGQDQGFQFHRQHKRSYKINFVNFNKLIIVKIKLNNQPMNFLIDTGVDNTVLFGLKDNQNDFKTSSKKIQIKGVSGQKKTYAYKIEHNLLELGKLKDKSHDVYVIFDQNFNISDKIGYPIQGILGYDFFKNHIVKINYMRNFMRVYNPQFFNKSLNSYDTLDLRLFKNKPYIKARLKIKETWQDFVFLLDTGSGDALWVKPYDSLEMPEDSFDDILGYGFTDIIRGKRSKAKGFQIGTSKLKTPKIAYPDTLAYSGVNFVTKSGVIGSGIMRRFHWMFDYKNSKVYLKPNSDISDDFNYDMSGLVLKYDGFQSVVHYKNFFPRVKVKKDNTAGYNKVDNTPDVYVELRPVLRVGAIRPNSSAFEAGFVEEDIIIKINGRRSDKYDLQEIMTILSQGEGQKINFIIERAGRLYEKSLILKSRFSEQN